MNKPTSISSQIPLPITGGDKATLANFWLGHNTELIAAIRACVETSTPRFIYFYGAKSSGKSHLLFAAMRLAQDEIINTSYLSLTDSNVLPEMLELLDNKHLVCLDNVDAWCGDETKERALFALFEQSKHSAGQLIVSASQPPDQVGFRLNDLASRFSSGLVYALQALTEEQQFEAIKMRAANRGLSISDDAVRYLLSRSSRDSAELFAILDDLDKASLIEKRRITIPFLQSLLNR